MSNRTRKEIASVHAKRAWDCSICGKRVFGNGGKSAHMRKHVRQAGLFVENYPSTRAAYLAAITKLAKLHVYQWQGHRYECREDRGCTREIVATTSRSAARVLSYADHSNMRPKLEEIQPAVHKDDIAQAMSEPGVVFWRPIDQRAPHKWRRAK